MDHILQADQIIDNEVTEKLRYAGFWMRFWAYLVDSIVVFSLGGLLLTPLRYVNNGMPIDISVWTLNGLISIVVFYLYFLIMTKVFQQTIGKMLFGLQVVRLDQEPLRWSDLLFREVIGRFIYKAFFILNLLYIVVAFTPEKQGLHDMIGNTTVVHVE